jgi:hypothetical protein
MTSVQDEWAGIEYIIEVLDDVRKRLRAGAKGPGTTLTPDECLKVLACLKDPPNPAHAPKQTAGIRQTYIAMCCLDLEDDGVPLKAAVTSTMQRFGCSRSTVYAARKELLLSK